MNKKKGIEEVLTYLQNAISTSQQMNSQKVKMKIPMEEFIFSVLYIM